MARFRLTVRKTEVSHEVIEVDAVSALEAARRGSQYTDGLSSARRAATVVRTYDEDTKATELTEVISVKEV